MKDVNVKSETDLLFPIPFNRPFMTGRELDYISEAVRREHISGNGSFTKKCQEFFHKRYGFERCLLTSSCTDALEMCSLLLDIQPGDEVIVPGYTFVSSANAFVLRGAEIRFADSSDDTPNVDPDSVEGLITKKTKAIVVVHYGGIACDMDRLCAISEKYGVPIIEDAAHAIDSFHNDRPLGSIGALSTFSFHETKNIICGEGGLLVVNDPQLWGRAEIIWEKGTNRAAFARKEVQKYQWVDVGSSFLPSEITAAFLLSQLEHIGEIQTNRVALWQRYRSRLEDLIAAGSLSLPAVPSYATVNGHLFPIIVGSRTERDELLQYLVEREIYALFHYLMLNESPYFSAQRGVEQLPNGKRFENCLIRLPLFYQLTFDQIDAVCSAVAQFYGRKI